MKTKIKTKTKGQRLLVVFGNFQRGHRGIDAGRRRHVGAFGFLEHEFLGFGRGHHACVAVAGVRQRAKKITFTPQERGDSAGKERS